MRGLGTGWLDSACAMNTKLRVDKQYNESNFDDCFHNTEAKTVCGLTLWAFHDKHVNISTIPVESLMTFIFNIKSVPKSVTFKVDSIFYDTLFLVLHDLDNPKALAVFNPPLTGDSNGIKI